jgi:NitT/TauT family transport system substrate-binding protein
MKLTRRNALKAGAAFTAAPFINSSVVFAQERPKLTYATLAGGVSTIINEYLKVKRPDLDNGLELEIISEYTSVSSYYSDLISGTFELGIGAWDTFLRMHRREVPVRLAATMTTGTMINILASEGGPASVDELKGRTIAAIASSGAYNMCLSTISKLNGITLGEDVEVQNVPSPFEALTLVMSGNVDAGVSWEPSVSIAMARDEKLRPIFNLGEAYKEANGLDMPYFGFAVRQEALDRDAEIAAKLQATFGTLAEQMNANPMEVFELTAPALKTEASVLMSAYEAGRLEFTSEAMSSDAGRASIRTAQAFLDEADANIDDSFFV